MARRRYLVAYDIREPKRLRDVHSLMKGFGHALQYSVFVCDLDRGERIQMMSALGGTIHHSMDSVAIVDLGESESRGAECFEFMGVRGTLPESGFRVL